MSSKFPTPTPVTAEGQAVLRHSRGVEGDVSALTARVNTLETRLSTLYDLIPLHDLGVVGWDHRFVASRVIGDIGDSVTSWTDRGDTPTNLTGTDAVIADAGDGSPVVQFRSGTYTGPVGAALPGTLAMVVRQPNTSSSARVTALGARLNRNTGGDWQLADEGAGSGSGVATRTGGTGWYFVAWSLPNTSTFRFQANASDTTTGTGTWTAGTPVALTISGQTGFEIAELVTWPTALSDTDLDTVYAAMQAEYTFI